MLSEAMSLSVQCVCVFVCVNSLPSVQCAPCPQRVCSLPSVCVCELPALRVCMCVCAPYPQHVCLCELRATLLCMPGLAVWRV